MIKEITAELQQAASSELAAHHQRFFKTEQGEYGEGDLFLGLKVPQIRTIAKKYTKTAQAENLAEMLQSPYHEVRLAALVIMLEKFAKGSREIREQMHQIYMDNLPERWLASLRFRTLLFCGSWLGAKTCGKSVFPLLQLLTSSNKAYVSQRQNWQSFSWIIRMT